VGLRLPEVVGSGGLGVVRETSAWIPSLDIALGLRLDGLSALFLIIVLGIGALVMAYSARYMSERNVHPHTGYFAWMLLFAFAMTGLVLSDDLVLLFVFWELTTLCSFFLINRSGDRAGAPAVRTLLVTAMGGLSLLFAVVLIVIRTETTVVSEALASSVWADDPGFSATIAVLVAVAAMTKSAQFPFHMWLPDAMVAPTPVSAYLHAAAMVKAGIFLLMLFSPALAGNAGLAVAVDFRGVNHRGDGRDLRASMLRSQRNHGLLDGQPAGAHRCPDWLGNPSGTGHSGALHPRARAV